MKRTLDDKTEPDPKVGGPKYWCDKGRYQKEYNAIWESDLVPLYGPAENKDLNMLLEWNYIYKRCYNDGEVVTIRDAKVVENLCKRLWMEAEWGDINFTDEENEILCLIHGQAKNGRDHNFVEMEDPDLASLLDKVMDWIIERLLAKNADVKKLLL